MVWGEFMFDNMENLKIISSFHKQSKVFGKVENRQTHGFIIKIKGHTDYIIKGGNIGISEGELIFLPKGSCYEYKSDPNQENTYTSINFQAELENPQIGVYSVADFYDAEFLYQSFSELWRFGNSSDKYKCMSVFYNLISYISKIEHMESSQKRKSGLIDPAVEYLKKHIYENDFKTEKLHHLCGISDTYFRKIFMLRFNMTPQEYIIVKRLSHAKAILESGDYDTIREVAESVGYSDPLYFGKAFKKIYGFAPSNVNE